MRWENVVMPEADILVVWNDGSAAVIGKISTETYGGGVRIKCSRLGRGLGWEFIKVGFRMLFSSRRIDADKLYKQKKDKDREILHGGEK